VFRYTTPDGREDATANPNGSLANIAGVCNRERNVVGLMPHPERAIEKALGSSDGLVILRSLIESLTRRDSGRSPGGHLGLCAQRSDLSTFTQLGLSSEKP
jgi:hypothetical protein